MTTMSNGEQQTLPEVLLRRLNHTAELAAGEIQLAGVSALTMLLLVVIASAAVVISWGLIVASLILMLRETGLSWQLLTAAFAAVHALLAVACWQIILHLSRNLSLPALRAAMREQA